MRTLLTLLTLVVCWAALLSPAVAQTAPVRVENAWSRATPPGARTGVLFLTLTSPSGDRLTGVSSPAAGKGEIHEMTMEGMVMRMRELPDGLELPAGKPVTLAPGGLHVMLTGLVAPLKQGQRLRVHLTFAKAPAVDVEVAVGSIGAATAPH